MLKIRTVRNLLALILVFATMNARSQDLTLNSQTISAPFSISQEPLRGNFLPNPGKEIILIGEKEGRGQLAIFAVDTRSGEYELYRHLPIDASYFAFDSDAELKVVGKSSIAAQRPLHRLYFLTSTEIIELQPEQAEQPFQPLLKVQSIFIKQSSNYLKRGNFVRYLNHDRHPDFALADFNGLNLYVSSPLQAQGEAKGEAPVDIGYERQQLPITPVVEVFESSVSYTRRKWFLADMNQDQLADIAWVDDGKLLVYLASPLGEFSSQAQQVNINSRISGQNWWDTRNADGSNLDQSNLDHQNLESMDDINGDGIVDLVVRHSTSSGVLDRSNDYQVFFGQVSDGSVSFQQQPSTVLASDGTVGDIQFIDLNRDARQEVLMSSFDISVSQIIGALLSGSVDQDVLIYVQDASSGAFRKSISKEVELTFSLSTGKSGAPIVKLADLNGDGYKELILSADENKLKIYAGVNGDKYITNRAQRFSLPLPQNGVFLTSDDLNDDGKEELLVRYGDEDDAQYHDDLVIISAK
ncbi:FG-GAP repeat domain-containing protein [Thalassotalea mangrovi]|uniref:VCBS repeat-containing protein n=1 Tax=Thalassotalea mangrovi TaxID=2572245 RepID=A0A4U1B7X1_9GAMM|nr:VCBS repeat-containing protein [Thalassotalea mangrovi]TKB46082.1 VCBS repeat-containing protein [Thalassotalea mangrovi]